MRLKLWTVTSSLLDFADDSAVSHCYARQDRRLTYQEKLESALVQAAFA